MKKNRKSAPIHPDEIPVIRTPQDLSSLTIGVNDATRLLLMKLQILHDLGANKQKGPTKINFRKKGSKLKWKHKLIDNYGELTDRVNTQDYSTLVWSISERMVELVRCGFVWRDIERNEVKVTKAGVEWYKKLGGVNGEVGKVFRRKREIAKDTKTSGNFSMS